MRYYILLNLLVVIGLCGCQDIVNLEENYAHYFKLINTSKNYQEIKAAEGELTKLVETLEAENNIHRDDFSYLLGLYHAKETIRYAQNPKNIKRFIKRGLDPSSDPYFVSKYQRALKPISFVSADHQKELKTAFKLAKRSEFYVKGQRYEFVDLIKHWSIAHNFQDKKKAREHLSKSFERGICRGVAEQSNKIMCENPELNPQDIILQINNNFSKTLLAQLKHEIATSLLSSPYEFLGQTYRRSEEEERLIQARLDGFILSENIKIFMGNLIKNSLDAQKNLFLRVSFRGNKVGHAIALQVLPTKYGYEYRIIDNNIGILSYNSIDDFLSAFALYRRNYYLRQATPSMVAAGDLCL